MDPLLEVQRKSMDMDRDAYRESLDRPVKAVTESTPYRLADLILNGDDVDLPLAESMIPTVPLQAKLKQGKTPGLADILDVPNPLKAMGPIAFGLKEFRNGARMGKTLRNIEKAKNPYIERWHRTRSKNDRSIQAKGLLVGKDNPNYGKNTGDQNRLPTPAAWLGTSPTEIPVLQFYAMNRPHEISTYRVRIPKDEYYSTPRLKWDMGFRGDARDARIVGKGESSLTGEVGRRTGNESLIDLFGKTIPPEYLKRVPNRQIAKMKKHADEMMYYRGEHGRPEQTLAEVGNDIVKNEMFSWMPISDRVDLYGYRTPTLKSIQYVRPDETLRLANEQLMQNPRGIPKYGMQYLDGDLPEKFSTTVKYHRKPSLKGLTSPENVATGHVSRGWQSPVATDEYFENWDPKKRAFDWNEYKRLINRGGMPFRAAYASRPSYRLVDDPIKGLRPEYVDDTKFNYGAISRGFEGSGGLVSRLNNLARTIRISGLEPDSPHRLADILTDNTSHLNSVALESIAKSNPWGRFGGLQDAVNSGVYRFNRGAIARGEDIKSPSLKRYHEEKMEEYVADNDWQYDDTPEGMEEMVEAANKYANDELRELMRENAAEGEGLYKAMHYRKATSPMQ